MFYEEKIEDGKLWIRTHPDGEWQEATYQQLLQKYAYLKKRKQDQDSKIFQAREQIKGLQKKVDAVAENSLFR